MSTLNVNVARVIAPVQFHFSVAGWKTKKAESRAHENDNSPINQFNEPLALPVAPSKMSVRPPVIRDQDRIDVRLTSEAEYRIPFTFIEALNEGTLFDRPEHAFLDAARERRLFHVLNRTTDNIIGTGIIQASGDEKSAKEAEVGGLMFHPAARGFGLCSLLVKIMMVYAIKESGRDSPDEEYLAHVVDGNGLPLHSLLEAGFRAIEGFVFDREAIGKLVLSLWKFVNEDHGVITRSDPAGDIRMTVDFSHVIPPTDLNI